MCCSKKKNGITLYTAELKRLNIRFETLNDEEGGCGGLHMDTDDRIYVSYTDAKKIQVFSPEGGKALREIPCDGYEPQQIAMCDDLLIIKNYQTILVIDKDGNVKHKVSKANMYPYATVTDNRILIAWVNYDGGLVSINEYNEELHHIKTLITDYQIEKPERQWYYLREFRSGEIAFCTPDRLYIFNLEV